MVLQIISWCKFFVRRIDGLTKTSKLELETRPTIRAMVVIVRVRMGQRARIWALVEVTPGLRQELPGSASRGATDLCEKTHTSSSLLLRARPQVLRGRTRSSLGRGPLGHPVSAFLTHCPLSLSLSLDYLSLKGSSSVSISRSHTDTHTHTTLLRVPSLTSSAPPFTDALSFTCTLVTVS